MFRLLRRTAIIGAGSAAAASVLDRTLGITSNAIGEPAERTRLASTSVKSGSVATASTGDMVRELARSLSEKPYMAVSEELPPALAKIDYDQYRDIRFRNERAIWRGENLGFELQLFTGGWLYKSPVELYISDDGVVTQILPVSGMFETGRLLPDMPADTRFALSGFRIHAPINRTDYLDEFVVFQGASYLRAVARGQQYGLSARGLAVDTGQPKGEEFPVARQSG